MTRPAVNYYNEFDPKAAAWLRELIAAGLIPAGDVDTRSITEVKPHDLRNYTQCHFFAGIAGWSLALQLAGWPSARPVWTGSCPCQPFSSAGKQLGTADERHLWPVFFNLIRECRPDSVFGEQVASAIGKGWLDGVSADLEAAGYACGASVLGAHSVGSPHIRQRLFWVADAGHRNHGAERRAESSGRGVLGRACCGMAYADGGLDGTERARANQRAVSSADGRDSGGLVNSDRAGPQPGHIASETDRYGRPVVADGRDSWLDHSVQPRLEGLAGHGDDRNQPGRLNPDTPRPVATAGRDSWSRFDLIPCADGKARRIEPGLAPLAHGVPARVVRLRGYGNAIVPQVAAEFVGAFLEIQNWRN